MIPIRDLNPTRSTPWVTWTILLVCTLVYLWQSVLPPGSERDFVYGFGLVPQRITSSLDADTLVTVLTSMFMHGGFMHALGNLWFLHIFGDNVEDNMGPARFAVFYLLCGVAAAITQVAMNPSSAIPMVGASGAIAGVLAAYLVLYAGARVVTLIPIFIFLHWTELPAWVFIAFWFVMQFFSGVGSLANGGAGGGVAYWAHIGGFIAGIALVFVFRSPRPPTPRIQWQPPSRGRAPWQRSQGW